MSKDARTEWNTILIFPDVFNCQKFYEVREQTEPCETLSKRERLEEESMIFSLLLAHCSVILTVFSILHNSHCARLDSMTFSFIAINLKTHAQSHKHHHVCFPKGSNWFRVVHQREI